MTNPELRNPDANYHYYAHNQDYLRDDSRLQEHRVLWAAERLRHQIRPGMRVLDLGACDGFFAELLPSDIDYVGVELNEKARNNAYPNAKGKLRAGNAAKSDDWGPGMFDRVFFGEVLEHLPNPLEALQHVRSVLAPSGRIASTSASGFGEAHEPGNKEHLREWTLPEFRKLHEDAGFEVLEGGYALVYRNEQGVERYANVVWAKRTGDS